MPFWKVRRTLVIQAEIDVIVQAANAEEADWLVETPSNVGTDYRTAGWKATVQVKPPKTVKLDSKPPKVTWIDTASGGEPKPRRITGEG